MPAVGGASAAGPARGACRLAAVRLPDRGAEGDEAVVDVTGTAAGSPLEPPQALGCLNGMADGGTTAGRRALAGAVSDSSPLLSVSLAPRAEYTL